MEVGADVAVAMVGAEEGAGLWVASETPTLRPPIAEEMPSTAPEVGGADADEGAWLGAWCRVFWGVAAESG